MHLGKMALQVGESDDGDLEQSLLYVGGAGNSAEADDACRFPLAGRLEPSATPPLPPPRLWAGQAAMMLGARARITLRDFYGLLEVVAMPVLMTVTVIVLHAIVDIAQGGRANPGDAGLVQKHFL